MRVSCPHRTRANIALICLIVGFAVLTGRLFYLQRTAHAGYAQLAIEQGRIRFVVPAERGCIYACDGTKIAMSVPSGQVCADVRRLGEVSEVAMKLAPVLGVDAADIYDRLTGDRLWVVLARQVPFEKARLVSEMNLKGVHVLRDSTRVYPHGRLFCHIVGACGLDGQPLAGAEVSLEGKLRGSDGVKVVARDARQRRIELDDGCEVAPKPGQSVVLTLDPVIQSILSEELSQAVKEYEPIGAWAVAMDPRTGRVRGMVSWPDYDPNDLSTAGADSMRNRVITDFFEPGSTFKPVVWAKSLELGTATPGEKISCENGAWQVGTRTIHSAHPYGVLTFEMGLVKSDNVMASKLGSRLGIARLYECARLFGYGRTTGIELPGESPGLLRPRSEWTQYSVTSVPMGQEVAVTPLQLVAAQAAFANGGMLVRPTIVERFVDSEGKVLSEAANPPRGRAVPEGIAFTIRELLRRAVQEGTGQKAKLDQYSVCGKTGTAQKAGRGGYIEGKYIGSFVGFAPAEDPRLVVLVSLDEPKGEYYGGAVAAPAAGSILKRSLVHLGVPQGGGALAEGRRR